MGKWPQADEKRGEKAKEERETEMKRRETLEME